MCLHMEDHFVGATKTWGDYMWRLFRKHDQKVCKLHVECCKNLNLKFIEISSTPWCGAVDQEWRSKLHAPKHTSSPPGGSTLALLSFPSQSGEVPLNPRYQTFVGGV